MSDNNGKKSFVAGAAILGVAGLITKLLGAVFRIPLANIIGASGMAYYQTAYPVYVMLLMISTTGLPTAISRMVAERRAVGQYHEAHRVFAISFKLMLSIGVVTGIGLFIFAPAICNFELEPEAVYAMRATAPALILCPMMSCFRGFFQGRKTMTPTAVSQVAEQFFRVGLGLFLAYLLLKIDAPHAAAGASCGASVGGLFGFIAVYIVYLKKKPEIVGEFEDTTPLKTTKEILKEILVIAVPITIGAGIMPIMNWIDTLVVKRRLLAIGYSDEVARTLFGELSGLAAPIINFPIVFTMAVCMSLVPVITDAFKKGDNDFIKENASLSLRYSAVIIMPCAAGMVVLAEPIMKLLYPRQIASAISAAGCLAIYAIGMIFLSTTQATNGVLQGIGKQMIPVRSLAAGAVVKLIATFVLTGIPAINVKGAAVGSLLANATAATLNIIAVKKYTGFKVDWMLSCVKPFVSSLIMGAFAFMAYKLASFKFGNTISTFIAILAGVVIYVIIVLLTKTVTIDELKKIIKRGK